MNNIAVRPHRSWPTRDADLARRLNSVTVHVMRALRQETDASGLAAEHRTALGAVVYDGPIRIGALARREGVSAPAMTKTVALLETKGLVVRRRDADDARVVHVRATRAGKDAIVRGRDERVARIARALARIERGDLQRIEGAIVGLERLVSELENGR